jgi:hypothetical protein
MRYTLVAIFLLITVIGFSQPSDFLVLKKKGKTIKSYYAGTQIEFVTVNGVYKNALINKIRNDSLFIQEFMIQQAVTQFGFYVIDTLGSFRYAYPYKDIKSIGKPQKGFNLQASGSGLLGGGILLTLASGVVYLADRKKFSPELMAASAGLGLIGYFLSKTGSKGIVIGKKTTGLNILA